MSENPKAPEIQDDPRTLSTIINGCQFSYGFFDLFQPQSAHGLYVVEEDEGGRRTIERIQGPAYNVVTRYDNYVRLDDMKGSVTMDGAFTCEELATIILEKRRRMRRDQLADIVVQKQASRMRAKEGQDG